MVEVKKKKGESFESLFRRFGRRIQLSGKILEAKKYRYFSPKKSKTAKHASALRKLEVAEKRAYLEKIGRLPVETFRGKR